MLTLLMKLGLSEKEARVYLALLELAKDTAIKIAAKAKMPRATTYVILEKLINLGLVSQVSEEGRTYFIAEDPHELDRLLESRISELKQRRESLADSIQQLTALYNRQQDKPTVRYYEGDDGLLALDRYRLAEEDKTGEIYAFVNFDALIKAFPKRREESVKERVKQKVKVKTIYSRAEGPEPKHVDTEDLREGVWVPSELTGFEGSLGIYTWGIKMFEFGASRRRGVLIEDKYLADMLRSLYQFAWLGAKHAKGSK